MNYSHATDHRHLIVAGVVALYLSLDYFLQLKAYLTKLQTSALLLFTSYHDQRKNNWHFHGHAYTDTGYCRQSNNTRYNLLGLNDSRCIERDDSISGLVKVFSSVSF